MINISFNIRSPIDKRDNRVIVRVRWNHKQYEVGFTTGMYAELYDKIMSMHEIEMTNEDVCWHNYFVFIIFLFVVPEIFIIPFLRW